MTALAVTLAALLAGAGEETLAARQSREFEEKILAELARVAPGAVADARAASEAHHADRWQEEYDAYARVLAAAPGFPHALRRQCRAKLELGDRDAAKPLCRAALQASPAPENRIALAQALVRVVGGGPTSIERSEGLSLARRALEEDPGDVVTANGACDVALRADDLPLLDACAERLAAIAPGELGSEYFGVIAAMSHEEWRHARGHLAAARAAGLPPELAGKVQRAIDGNEPAWSRWGPAGLAALGAWAGVLALLLAAGAVLSAVTLRRARRMATERDARGGRGAVALRRIYAAVLWLTCGVYYLSLPIIALLVLAAGWGTWMIIAETGRVPLKLVLIVAITVLVSLWAVLKSVWASVARGKGEDPGLRLDRAEHPRFEAALAEAASRVGTRPVDAVFVTPGTDAAVFERGGLGRQLAGRTERCLVLGVGLLDGMTEGQLKAVLAHEYGHFVNRDTAGGGFSLAVRRSILGMAETLASGGAAAWYNPAWLFVTRFYKLFLRVSQGASRLQEILADRWAALAYGGKAFADGLAHVVARSIRFDKQATAALNEVVDGSLPLPNLYRYEPAKPVEAPDVAAEVEAAMSAEPSPYDSHPRPVDRIAWVSGVAGAHGTGIDDGAPAWGLFGDREALERRLTEVVRENVARNHGVRIRADAPEPAEGAPAA